VYGKKNGKGHTSSPNLSSLPPTTDAFIENVKLAYLQTVLWRSLDAKPYQMNPEDLILKRDADNKSFNPKAFPDGTKSAPDYILGMTRCGCKIDTPCSTKRCSCKEKVLLCILFCAFFKIGCSRSRQQ
jgi:hypothetical protein